MLKSIPCTPDAIDADGAAPSCAVLEPPPAPAPADRHWTEQAARLLARFDEATPLGGREGLAAALLTWLRDGTPDAVLDELKDKRHARIADRLGLTGKSLPEDPARDAFYAGFNEMPIAAALRWARLLQQIVPGSARYSGIRLGGGRAWPTLLMMHAAGASVLLQTRTPPRVGHLSVDTMEALLVADGLPADSLLVAGFVTPARSGFLGWQPLLIGELAGFSGAVLRHIDAIRGLMVPSVPEQRLRVLALLKQIGPEAIEALAPQLVVLALTGGRQVLASSEPLLLRGGERMVAELSQVARDGTPDQRSGALRVIAKLARTHRREDWVDFCHETASADRAASVRTLLGEWAAQAQTDAALEQIVREAASHARNDDVAAILEPLVGEPARPGRIIAEPVPFEQPERAVAALSDGEAETRALAARHLGRIRHAAAVPALERTLWVERNDDTRGALLDALQALDQPIDHFLDREALGSDAARTLARGLPPELGWLDWPTLPRMRWADSGDTLPGEISQALIVDAFTARDPEPGTQLRQISAQLETHDREAFGQWILELWLAGPQGDTIASKGLLAIAAAFCGDQAAGPVQSYLRAWHDHRTAHCKVLVSMLAGIDQPAATQLLLAIGRRFGSAALQDEARLQIQRKATRRGWTPIELADRTLPSAGFDEDGRLELSYGARTFIARLRPDLTIALEDSDGGPLEVLPEPRRGDDPILAIDAGRALAEAQAELSTLIAQQSDRLYDAMCSGREWATAEWRDHLHSHPVMRHLVQRLVWIELAPAGTGPTRRSFRPRPDGSIVDLDGLALSLRPGARIIVGHDVLLATEDALRWQRQLADEDLRPLFRQFGRPVPTLLPDHEALSTFEGYLIKAFSLRSLAERFGYARGPCHDGRFDAYVKASAGLGLTCRIEFSGSRLPEENRVVALGGLRLVRSAAATGEEARASAFQAGQVTRQELLAIFTTECLNDLNRFAMAGTGFDPAWRDKVGN